HFFPNTLPRPPRSTLFPYTTLFRSLTMNTNSLNSLTENQQKIISDAALKVSEKQFKEAKQFDEHYVDLSIEHGIKYIELSEEERAQLAKVARAPSVTLVVR